MKTRKLGKSNLEVSAIGFGCMGPWIVPIPGTTKLHRLEENLGAADVELTADDLAEIARAVDAITVEGKRYPEQLMKTVGR